jgi:transposase
VGANFFDQEGKPVALTVKKGEKRILNKVFYMGKVFVNVIGWWQEGLSEPLWVMTSLPAEQGLAIYLQRMKIEQAFRDLKNLLGLEKMMHKKRELMEKMVAMMLIAYAISLVLGETLRTHLFAETRRKWQAYSGLFVLLKLKLELRTSELRQLADQALATFSIITLPVRTHV